MYLSNPLATGTDGSDILKPVKESIRTVNSPRLIQPKGVRHAWVMRNIADGTLLDPHQRKLTTGNNKKNTNMSNPGMT